MRLLESLKRGEKAEFTVIAAMFNNCADEDSFKDELLPTLIPGYDSSKNLYVSCELKTLTKVEDWYKDGTTMVKTIRKGAKGRSPYADSTIKRKCPNCQHNCTFCSEAQGRSKQRISVFQLPARKRG